ncbi:MULTISPECIES: hypothetical protein [Trichocoleus]|uniref:Uncharacterized protein n=1 Tax=Trichocoleus desertorum GB2-A4 TaxID=2933944 RepID=A0ABV0JFQ3_9CYAN|nr:hypothetical protein [Trichocoleus sp. FACHB-46]MBD1865698.1 hypothetical protein [Trichocoleus sp. FACHB-46]
MNAATIVALLSISATLLGILWQVQAKRMDERFAAHLKRIDKQLSDLYGPLYALFESGDKQWRAFLKEFSNCADPEFLGFFPIDNEKEFEPPSKEQLRIFRLWTENIFVQTDIRMEEIIINHAELLVGEKMPEPFLDFCVHVSSIRASVAEWKSSEFDLEDWRKHLAIFPHPAGALHDYIKASFEVLKKEQSLLLAGARRCVNERELNKKIELRIMQLRALEAQRKQRNEELKAMEAQRIAGLTSGDMEWKE